MKPTQLTTDVATIVNKPSKSTPLGIGVQSSPHGPHIISSIKPGGLLHDSPFNAGGTLTSVNDIDSATLNGLSST